MSLLDKTNLKVVTSHKLYKDTGFETIDQDGLLSERIFGPTINYKCACKKYASKSLYRGKTCPDCGVDCIKSDIRYVRFGKINLTYPVFNKNKKTKFRKLISKENDYLLDPKQNDLALSLKKFVLYDHTNDNVKIVSTYIPGACVPLNVTGNFTLYLSLLVIYERFQSKKIKELIDSFSFELLVVPPECRMSSKGFNNEGKERLLRNKLDDLYSQVVYLSKLQIETGDTIAIYVKMILQSYHSQNLTYISDENLRIADTIACKFQFYINEIYDNVSSLLSGKTGYIRKHFLGRTIDFSARAVVSINPRLNTHQIIVSKKIFLSLWFMEYLRFLRQVKNRQHSRLLYYVKSTDIAYKELEYTEEFISYFFKTSSLKNRLILINRQPTLWRYGIPCVEIIGVTNENVVMVSPLIINAMEMDFDGDTVALYKIHDNKALDELNERAFILNDITYDHNNDHISTIHSEADYALQLLLNLDIDTNSIPLQFKDVKYDYNLIKHLKRRVITTNGESPFGLVLLNKWIGLNEVKITKQTTIPEIYDIMYADCGSNEEYHTRLNDLNRNLNWFLSCHETELLTLPFLEAIKVVDNNNKDELIHKLPKNPYIGHMIYHSIVDKKHSDIPDDFQLNKLSRVKFKRAQFARSLVGVGYIADDMNNVKVNPITGSLLGGLTEDEFFETSYGSRKGITDKNKAVPDSGYLERSMVMNLSPIEITADDCGTSFGFNITIKNIKHALSLENRYFYNDNQEWELFTKNHFKSFIGKELHFRSPITCFIDSYQICQKCFGNYNIKTPFVGVLTGQYISERLTQLSMSSFHTSGSATLPIDIEIKEFVKKHLIDIENHEDSSTLIFDQNIPDGLYSNFNNITGFDLINDNKIIYNNCENVINADITQLVKDLNTLLKTESHGNIKDIHENYNEFLNSLLDINLIYSSFIEVLLCNLYVNKEGKVIRYALRDNEDINVYKKYNIKQLHNIISPILSLLYEPNPKSIGKISDKIQTSNPNKASIFERIWLGQL